MNKTMVRQPAFLEMEPLVIRRSKLAEREEAELTLADLLIINNETGLSIEQIERFLRACAVLLP